jgi:hypothetical protein
MKYLQICVTNKSYIISNIMRKCQGKAEFLHRLRNKKLPCHPPNDSPQDYLGSESYKDMWSGVVEESMEIVEWLQPEWLILEEVSRCFHEIRDEGNSSTNPGKPLDLRVSMLENYVEKECGEEEFN